VQTRRQFVRRAGATGAAVLVPQALGPALAGAQSRVPLRGGRFSDGLASGDPGPRSIALWSRVDEVERAGSVLLEVARDRDFRRVVARRRIATGAGSNHAVKARVTGLAPREQYFYRFATAGADSPIGRFRTAPAPGSSEPVRFAFFSCADYTHGYYNAYELMAREEDLDFAVNLGDYIYAESGHSRADGTGVRDDRIGRDLDGTGGSIRAAVTLADYRAKYSLYRSDASLRRMHASVPVVSIWDDHEVANNYAGGAPGGGLPAAQRFATRKTAAYRAFFENMPLFPSGRSRIYRALRYGRTLDLLLLDDRQYRADQPCGDPVAAPECPERREPRSFLGDRQLAWLKDELSASRAAWKVIGNQTFIMPVKSAPDRYAIYDTWQGYLQEREELVNHIGSRDIGGVVFATGDFHIFLGADIRPGESVDPATTVATEFHSGSITSETLGEGQAGIVPGANDTNPSTDPAIVNLLRGFNPWVDGADLDHHGYGVAEVTSSEMTVRFRRLQTIKRRSTARLPDLTWRVPLGRPSVKGQNAPA